jgi:hypothetical protein
MNRRLICMLVVMGLSVMGQDPISGKWAMTMETPGGDRNATPTFSLDGDKVSGKWDASEVHGTFKDGQLELEFPLTSTEAGFQAKFKVSAKLEGGTLKGTWSWATYDGKLSGKKQ